MSKKIKCALIGPGNIGTDLLAKLQRSPVLEPVWMVGIDPESDGLKRAREMGLKTTAEGVDGLLPHVLADGVQIAFDATSAYVHAENSRKLNELGVLMIDLTPAAIGPLCVPPVNLKEHADKAEMNVNMISCAGQATIYAVRVRGPLWETAPGGWLVAASVTDLAIGVALAMGGMISAPLPGAVLEPSGPSPWAEWSVGGGRFTLRTDRNSDGTCGWLLVERSTGARRRADQLDLLAAAVEETLAAGDPRQPRFGSGTELLAA